MSEGNPVVPGGFAPGSRIAGYLLEEQIGQGGMAVVFRAHDERLDRTVALKILAPALAADEAFRQRFIRESRAAAAVDDPHIIPVFEAGEASGVLFIAMRFVRGGDVRSLVGQFGPVSPGRVAEIVSQVASALDAAHGRGLVHRDVKPANMLLDASSGSGRPDHVYLSDFGLSKGSLQVSGLTGTGTFLGTLDYIAPEQIEGKPVDGRADEYALACAAFELLTGTPPFQRDEAMAVMYAQLSEAPPAVTSRRRDLPYAVDPVFAKALAKTPADRYASCRDFTDALREALGIRPYDSGPNIGPSGEHPATQVVSPSSPDAGAAAAGTDGGSAGRAAGYAGAGGYVAGGPGGQGTFGGPGQGGQGGYGPGQGGYGGPGPGQGQGPGGPGGYGPGGYGEAETQRAGGGPRTAPDPSAGQLQQGGPGGYGDYGGQASLARPWWKSPLAVVAAIVALIGGGAAAYALTNGGGGGGTTGGGTNNGQALPPLKPPGCMTNAASATRLHKTAFASVPGGNGNPFGVAVSKNGAVFVTTDSSVQVFKTAPDGSLSAEWHYSVPFASSMRQATFATLTPDGKYLLVASDAGIQVFDAAKVEADASSAYLGALNVPGVSGYGRAINIAVTPDSQFAFVSLQFGDQVGVFNLARAGRTGDFSSREYLGSLKVGTQPVGLTVSPDGQTLYATNFVANAATPGTLTVIDVVKATTKHEMQDAEISHIKTGCQPARVAVAKDNTVWVTMRASNYLLGYSAKLLRTDAAKALIAKVHIGQWPIGIALVNGGQRIVVSDNNGTDTKPASTSPAHNLALVDPGAALQRKPALLGYIPSGVTPRDMAVSPNGKFLYVVDRDSAQVQIVRLSTLP